MEVKLALLADGANVSREGKLNLLGIFDTLFARSFPTTHPQMQLVIRFEAAAHEAGSTRQVEIQLVAGDGNVLFRLPGALTVQQRGLGDAIRMDHVLTLNHVQFERPGRSNCTWWRGTSGSSASRTSRSMSRFSRDTSRATPSCRAC